ncbi:MAG: ACP S-malonyltransferase [Micrococcales bacterium]|nr:ACP S-malonyltransferase [Micrococcales bacterium]
MRRFVVFPGQGEQFPGMGRVLASRFPAASRVLAQVSDAAGIDLCRLMWESTADELMQTENAQPAIVAMSVAGLAAWRSAFAVADDEIAWASGHSVGALAAAAACGSLSAADAVRLARRRGEIMTAAPGAGAMLAVAVTSEQSARSARDTARGLGLDVACVNGPRQLVLSGNADAITEAQGLLRNGARRLAVSHAFHSRMMDSILSQWESHVSRTEFGRPRVPYLSGRTGNIIESADGVASDLFLGVRHPVRWDLVLERSRSCSAGVVCGSGRSMVRMWRGSPAGASITVVDDDFRMSVNV